jgi:hypothetical protein
MDFYARPIQDAYLVEGYEIVSSKEVGPWCGDTEWHYGNYYILNENNEYIPATGIFHKEEFLPKE